MEKKENTSPLPHYQSKEPWHTSLRHRDVPSLPKDRNVNKTTTLGSPLVKKKPSPHDKLDQLHLNKNDFRSSRFSSCSHAHLRPIRTSHSSPELKFYRNPQERSIRRRGSSQRSLCSVSLSLPSDRSSVGRRGSFASTQILRIDHDKSERKRKTPSEDKDAQLQFYLIKEAMEKKDPGFTGLIAENDFLDVLKEMGFPRDADVSEFLSSYTANGNADSGIPYRIFLSMCKNKLSRAHNVDKHSPASRGTKLSTSHSNYSVMSCPKLEFGLSPPPKKAAASVKSVPSRNGYRKPLNAGRSIESLFAIIKNVVRTRHRELEAAFEDIDEKNHGRLTEETMYTLFKRLGITPEITREEIKEMWKTFLKNKDTTLNYAEFNRHFGYTLQSAAYPNAKRNPPKKGDGNFLMLSQRLNCDVDILVDYLREHTQYRCTNVLRDFKDRDPGETGFVSRRDFAEVMRRLCLKLSDQELDAACTHFDDKGDGRVNYEAFLQPFKLYHRVNPRRWAYEMGHVVRKSWNSSDMANILRQSTPATNPYTNTLNKASNAPSKEEIQKMADKLRNQMQKKAPVLANAFRKLDPQGSGFVSTVEFASILKLSDFAVTNDDMVKITAHLDPKSTGKIPHKRFLQEYLQYNPQFPVVKQSRKQSENNPITGK